MGFFENLKERENVLLEELRQAKEIPLYIFGEGWGGRNCARFLDENGIEYIGNIVNKKYYTMSENTYCLEDLLEETVGQINIIVAFSRYSKEQLGNYQGKLANIFDYDCFGDFSWGNKNQSAYDWIARNEQKLQWTYDRLCDERSKATFLAFLNQKISMKYYLPAVKAENQYFDSDIINFTDEEVFVDCGAYTGDSAVAFVDALDKRGIHQYGEIISFEPDEDNFEKMCARNLSNHICIKKGVSDNVGTLYFTADNASGKLGVGGTTEVEIDTIDNAVGEKNVTLIKMDIEGSELAALRGAKETIKRCHPKLAICAYHKKEDLYELPQFILSLDENYRFYLRAYENFSNELVLYAL